MAYAFGHPKVVPLGASRHVPCVAAETAVLVIDVQYYCSRPGRGCHAGVEEKQQPYFFNRVENVMVPNIAKVLAAARGSNTEVVYTVIEALTLDGRDASLDYKLSGPLLVPKGHPDAAVLDEIAPLGDEILIPKTSCSVFCSTNIHYVLRNLGTRYLVVCGQLTNQCVESAVRDAADHGYLVTVVDDACAAKTHAEHEGALRNLKGFARIVSTAEIAIELDRQKTSEIPRKLQSAGRRICLLRTENDQIYGAKLPQMFHELLQCGGAGPFELIDFDVKLGKYPSIDDVFDGFIVPGSLSTIADGEVHDLWVSSLCRFVQKLVASQQALVGVCFGHQLIATALGGLVVRNPAGAQISRKTFALTKDALNVLLPSGTKKEVALPSHHCDAVVKLPAGALSWGYGASGHWGMTLGKHCFSTQSHPELSTQTGREVFRTVLRYEQENGPANASARGCGADVGIDEALRSMDLPTDHELLAQAFVRHFKLQSSDEPAMSAGASDADEPAAKRRCAASRTCAN
eukprot:TRINITY_DN2581_c0_g2_i3.p1 TRINITY_DN2581_c0_g2~~TRINITY_DN2581_c0_g2_i3.p1  ORF type:complete len:527 (-),score=73.02 TRINITY_DN2581_c0_g2_i3:573-2123(-)